MDGHKMTTYTDVLRDFFKFWEISDNISLTVQDGNIVAVEH